MLGQPFGSFRRTGRDRADSSATDPAAEAGASGSESPAADVTSPRERHPDARHERKHPTPVADCARCAERSERLLISHIEPGSLVTLDHPQLMDRHRRIVSFCSTPGRECPDREACATGAPCAVVLAAHGLMPGGVAARIVADTETGAEATGDRDALAPEVAARLFQQQQQQQQQQQRSRPISRPDDDSDLASH